MPHIAAPDHAARRLCRRKMPHDPRHGAQVVGGLVGIGAAPMTVHSFPLPPSANKYWRLARGRLIVSDEAKEYKRAVAMLARVDGVKLLTGPVRLTIKVFRARKSGDLDNRIKILADCLQGIFYENDAQVTELHAYLGDDKHQPRIEVEVTSCREPMC